MLSCCMWKVIGVVDHYSVRLRMMAVENSDYDGFFILIQVEMIAVYSPVILVYIQVQAQGRI